MRRVSEVEPVASPDRSGNSGGEFAESFIEGVVSVVFGSVGGEYAEVPCQSEVVEGLSRIGSGNARPLQKQYMLLGVAARAADDFDIHSGGMREDFRLFQPEP